MGGRPDMEALNEREIRLINRIVTLLNGIEATERYAVLSMLEKIVVALEGNRYYIAKGNRESSGDE